MSSRYEICEKERERGREGERERDSALVSVAELCQANAILDKAPGLAA